MKSLKPRVAPLDLRRVQPLTVRDQRDLGSYRWQQTRLRILREANGVCQCQECKLTGRLRPAHEVDHIVPVWEGGGEDDANLQAINRECHKAKTADEAKRRGGAFNLWSRPAIDRLSHHARIKSRPRFFKKSANGRS